MKRRLLLLDIVLLWLVILAGTTLRGRWLEAREREQRLLGETVPAIPPPAIAPIPPVVPAKAMQYVEVAQKMLFSRDRSATVILDPPPPPPPPKPMPQLPSARGVMAFGGTPIVMLSEKPGTPHRGYRPGEKVGEFRLLAVNNTHILFEWEGLRVLRRLEDISDKSTAPAEAAPAAASAAALAAPQVVSPVRAAPGIQLGAETKACVPGDNSPPGTVADGYRKVVTQTPFGASCRWELSK
ncbi:MAG TPA: hypothetical protein VFL57_04605 [Bryobacteraceae bacterium]|nr:hypothetical protein [Bryobacteraceae bacterium]